jgi:hypothetical protein
MQFSIDVLPAPFGPMIENSSPGWTEKLTSLSARTPPNTSDTSLICKMGPCDVITSLILPDLGRRHPFFRLTGF